MSTNPPSPEQHGSQPTPPAYHPPAQGHESAPPAAPGYAAAPPAPGAYEQQGSTSPNTKKTLGIVAFIAAAAAIVIGSILAYAAGMQFGSLMEYAQSSGGSTTLDAGSIPASEQGRAVGAAMLSVTAYIVMGILGLWGLIQGIIAAVKNRGRGWGIAAIVVAVLAAVPVTVFYGVGVAAGAAPYLS